LMSLLKCIKIFIKRLSK